MEWERADLRVAVWRMPVTQGSAGSDKDMRLFFRDLVIVTLLSVGSAFAQVVTIRVVNPHDKKPVRGRQVAVSLFYEKGESASEKGETNLSFVTDANGEAHFSLPNPAPRNISAQVHLPDIWNCACLILTTTEEVVRIGVIAPKSTGGSEKSAPAVKAVPGEILFLVRPPSFWERLLYPLEKG